jgi:predicted nucleic acid-binding Zn ribbon protein
LESVSGVVARLLRGLGLEDGLRGWRAVAEWPEVVGPQLARHARAVEYHDGALLVEVEGSAWMHELGFLKRDLVRRINQRLGADVVREVKLTLPRGGTKR